MPSGAMRLSANRVRSTSMRDLLVASDTARSLYSSRDVTTSSSSRPLAITMEAAMRAVMWSAPMARVCALSNSAVAYPAASPSTRWVQFDPRQVSRPTCAQSASTAVVCDPYTLVSSIRSAAASRWKLPSAVSTKSESMILWLSPRRAASLRMFGSESRGNRNSHSTDDGTASRMSSHVWNISWESLRCLLKEANTKVSSATPSVCRIAIRSMPCKPKCGGG
mmetsp:Transcript_23287/g.38946  ORF Transcript_23287/g.38946 Transcript_23287/m.38946 type:complete len:222 (-) Transcript_23287:1591-2256(-)